MRYRGHLEEKEKSWRLRETLLKNCKAKIIAIEPQYKLCIYLITGQEALYISLRSNDSFHADSLWAPAYISYTVFLYIIT